MSVTIDPRVLVSWDGTGAFDGPYDDVSADVAADSGFSVEYGRDGAQALSPPKVAAGSTVLFNGGGKYSQERGDSPVYQRVLPGRPVRYQITYDKNPRLYRADVLYRDAVWYRGEGVFQLGQHTIESITQSPGEWPPTVTLDTLGYESVLTKAVVSINLLTAPRVDECISILLYQAGWPSDKRDIAVSDTTLAYWWCDERHPWDALMELLAAEGPGAMYVDGQGVFHFENRNYKTTTTRSTTPQATLYDQDTSGLWFTDMSYEPNFKSIYNRATYATRRRTVGSLAPVWQYGTDLALSAGQTVTLIARPQDPFMNAITPVAGTDFTVTGTGTVSVVLGADSGFVAYVTVTALGSAATVSGLQFRAQPLVQSSETTVENTIDASASIAKYSPVAGQDVPITLDVQGWPEIDTAQAQGVCDSWVARYQEVRPTVSLTARAADAAHVEQMLRRMPSDRITVFETNTGLDADLWINGVRIAVTGPLGVGYEVSWECEKVDSISGARWDVDLWDDAAAVWGI
jgi:hypothetical protein